MPSTDMQLGVPDADAAQQVTMQCAAVRHLAMTIAMVHGDKAAMFAEGHLSQIVDFVGRNTARLMETLGDVLNDMDAAAEDDGWLDPIFEEAHRRWPIGAACSHCGADPTTHKELIEALRPFAAFGSVYSRPRISVEPSDTIICSQGEVQVTLADLDRARALLAKINGSAPT